MHWLVYTSRYISRYISRFNEIKSNVRADVQINLSKSFSSGRIGTKISNQVINQSTVRQFWMIMQCVRLSPSWYRIMPFITDEEQLYALSAIIWYVDLNRKFSTTLRWRPIIRELCYKSRLSFCVIEIRFRTIHVQVRHIRNVRGFCDQRWAAFYVPWNIQQSSIKRSTGGVA